MAAVGLVIGFFVVGPLFCWLVGMGNPMGWMGVPPWRVPACQCPEGHRRPMHHQQCPISQPPRR